MEHRAQVKVLQDRIKQLETRTRENLSEKAGIFDKLSSERGDGYLLMHGSHFCGSVNTKKLLSFCPTASHHPLPPPSIPSRLPCSRAK